jgi:peptide/nickel transport system permease protein
MKTSPDKLHQISDRSKTPGSSRGRRGPGRGLGVIARHLLSLLGTLFAASLLVFFSRFLVPGDPARFLLRGRSPSQESIDAVTAEYGLDLPPWEQYLRWIGGVVQGDFGRSMQYRDDVTTVLLSRLPVTFELVAMAGLLTVALGVGAGVCASLKRGRFTDRAILMTATALGATPAFVIAILLIAIFAVGVGWLPSFGSGDSGVDRFIHLILPALSLALALIALVARVTRSSMNEQFTREHVEVAMSRGLTKESVVLRHVLRNALGPILLVTGVLIAGLIVTSAIVEQAFGLAGLGSLLVQSVERLDFAVVQAIVLLVVLIFVTINTLVDLVQPLLDPRISAGSETR